MEPHKRIINQEEGKNSMDISKIVIVPKITSLDYTMTQFHMTREDVFSKWKDDGMTRDDIQNNLQAHENHHHSLSLLKRLFDEKQFVHRNDLNREYVAKADAVISLGGDDHLQYVSHFIESTPIISVNSDPIRSNGNLLYFTAQEIMDILPLFKKDEHILEQWTRLSATINAGKNVIHAIPAMSQYALITEDPEGMARMFVELNGQSEKQRGSGLLIATGAGLTGWYKGASLYMPKTSLSRTERAARVILREPWSDTPHVMSNPLLKEGDELLVTYFTHTEGRLSSDTYDRYSIVRGNKVSIRISDMPLNVVNLAR